MAEISDQPPAPPPATVRTSPPGTKRLVLILTVLATFLLGFPFLLRSTAIHRSPLPSRPLSASASPPCRLHAVFLDGTLPSSADEIGKAISHQIAAIRGGSRACGGCTMEEVAVTVERNGRCEGGGGGRWRCGVREIRGLEDEVVDRVLMEALSGGDESGGGKVYSVVVAGGGGVGRVVVGKHRHAWVVGEMEAVKTVAKVFVEVFMYGAVGEDGEDGEFMPVGSDGSVTLSFSLLNANPKDWVYGWDFQNVGEAMLAPVVEALAPLANVKIESQVLYHAPKSSFSHWDEKSHAHIFSTEDLPFFVNSKEWHLDSSTAAAGRSKLLHLVLYVPSVKECPLLLHLPNGEISTTNGFVSPMWGGVIVWNPPTCSMDSSSQHLKKNMISPQDFHKLFEVFIAQLRLLFGLKSDSNHSTDSGIFSFLASDRGFTKWELDFLFRKHACLNLLSCSTTLQSLSNLVESLPRMIVMDEIGKQVKLSLEAASFAQENASLGIYSKAAASSRQARSLVEDAFFHPSIMSISYSSLEHYVAIYMPYFAPVAVHVVLAAVKEFKRYRQERRNFLAFVESQKTS